MYARSSVNGLPLPDGSTLHHAYISVENVLLHRVS